ncbi:hypothetical protein [Streptomyces shenzhenensis]|uniref:hypothetical protein n=1 Tax=Streptomyces shenzhenensis TaxID=943815 RepID=UPI0036B8C0FD
MTTLNQFFEQMGRGKAERERQVVPLTREELASMSPAEIDSAKRAGRLDGILRGVPAAESPVPEGQLSNNDIASLSPAEIVAAKKAGKLNAILGIEG